MLPLPPKPSSLEFPLYYFDLEFQQQGFSVIAGVDEVGRGCLAGPVVAAACILPLDSVTQDSPFAAINDSKKLTPQKRTVLAEFIRGKALAFGYGLVEPEEIDRINILQASLKAMQIACEQLTIKPDCLLVDGGQKIHTLAWSQQTVVHGDGLSLSIAAASILAKVYRDQLMESYHGQFPDYGFAAHKGYGTKEHLSALRTHGPTPIHRRTFSGVI